MIHNLWHYSATLIRATSWKAALALGLMVSFSLMEGIGLLLLIPLLHLVGLDVQYGTLGRIVQLLSSLFIAAGVRPTLASVLIVYAVIMSMHALLFRWRTSTNFSLNYEFVGNLRQQLYRSITYTNWLLFSRSRTSDFTHVLTTEVDRVGAVTYQLLHLFATGIVAAVYVVVALKISAKVTLFIFACGGGLVLMLRGKVQTARGAGEGLSQTMSSLYSAITEHLGGMKTAKSYGAEEQHITTFAGISERVQQMYIRTIRNQAEVKYWFDIGSVLVLSIIVYFSFEILGISTAELLVLLFLFARIMPKISIIQQGYQGLVNVLPALDTVMEMQARCDAAAEPKSQRREKIPLRASIQLERITFTYDNVPVIQALDMTVRASETTAIVGQSGAGKSTIADLIIGLITPTKGSVLLDGVPLGSERIHAWRDNIGYVAQETFLFNETVRDNLLWAYPDASEEEIWQALRLAAADAFVTRLPEELDTVVGERGILLAAGERQRLALARALLRKPSLLIMDEATSNLDSENEQRIQRAIEGLHRAMTILIISHRLSTVREADIIYVVEEGRLVESGTWDSLIARGNGRFRVLARIQGIEVPS